MKRAMELVVAVLMVAALLAVGFELGARSVKFSPADSVEFSGLVVGGKVSKSMWRM